MGPWHAAWFVVKPNRLVAGAAQALTATTPGPAVALAAAWAALLLTALTPRAARIAAAPLAAAVTAGTLALAGHGGSLLMEGLASSARVALGIGFWVTLGAAYVAWFGAAQAQGGRRSLWLSAAATVLIVLCLLLSGQFADLGLAREFATNGADFRAELARHLSLSGASLLLGVGIGVPAAFAAHRDPRVAAWLPQTAALFQTIPSLALFGVLLAPLARVGQGVTLGTALLLTLLALPLLLVRRARSRWLRGAFWLLAAAPALLWLTIGAVAVAAAIGWLLGAPSLLAGPGGISLDSRLAALGVRGIGAAPALVALTLYSLLPIVRNTLTGLQGAPQAVVTAGRGMGMSSRQILLRVEVPLALPLMIQGVRAAAVLVIGITTVAFLIGAGGLGVFIQRGIDQVVPELVLLGALPVIALALLADAALRAVGLLLLPPPLRGGPEGA